MHRRVDDDEVGAFQFGDQHLGQGEGFVLKGVGEADREIEILLHQLNEDQLDRL